MATVKGVNKTLIDAGGLSNKYEQGYLDGRVKCFFDQYEVSSTVSGTVIEMGPELPVGSKILEVILSTDDIGGSATTLAVGDLEDTDRYISATNHGDGSVTTRLNKPDGLGYEVDMTTATTPDNQITITTGNSTSGTTGTINLVVFYTKD